MINLIETNDFNDFKVCVINSELRDLERYIFDLDGYISEVKRNELRKAEFTNYKKQFVIVDAYNKLNVIKNRELRCDGSFTSYTEPLAKRFIKDLNVDGGLIMMPFRDWHWYVTCMQDYKINLIKQYIYIKKI